MRVFNVLLSASLLIAGLMLHPPVVHAEGDVAKDVREDVCDVDKDVDRDGKDIEKEVKKLDKERHKEDRHLDKEEKKHL
jgi:hypothetical protein